MKPDHHRTTKMFLNVVIKYLTTKKYFIKQKTCSVLKNHSSFLMLRLQKWQIPKNSLGCN